MSIHDDSPIAITSVASDDHLKMTIVDPIKVTHVLRR